MATSYQWPLGKLDIINSALAQTGNNLCMTANDGSDEWNAASPTYERGLAYATESHGWGWTTQTIVLQPGPVAPTNTSWDTAYPLPPDCVHVIWARVAQVSSAGTISEVTPSPVLYDFEAVGNPPVPCLVTNAQGGPPPPITPTTPAQVTIRYISQSFADSTLSTPTFVIALQAFTMSGIYRGLHEDTAEADKMWQAAELYLQRARTRYDQQKPKRAPFNSRITASRRIRRPWPQIGNNSWGGTNSPGIVFLCIMLPAVSWMLERLT